MLGIALGIAALITVMSVMNGFQKEVRARILGVSAHVQVMGAENGLQQWQTVREVAMKNPEVVGTAPFVNGQGLLAYSSNVRGAMVRGIIPSDENAVANLGRDMKVGEITALRPGEYNIILGADLARQLGVKVGTKVLLITPPSARGCRRARLGSQSKNEYQVASAAIPQNMRPPRQTYTYQLTQHNPSPDQYPSVHEVYA